MTDAPPFGSLKSDYTAYGAAAELFNCRDKEILLAGPAGTGKSRAALEKLYAAAVKYPGMRGLIIRKTRASLSEAALQTWEEHVLPENSPLRTGVSRSHRNSYILQNGSHIDVGGFDVGGQDATARIMSREYDMIYIQEATECSERDWENATSRLRSPVMPYRQLIGDCNPDAPHHWLYQRCQSGFTKMLHSRHADNPTVTESYLETLSRLTGVRRQRLFLGLWVAAKGQVYEGWDERVHRVDAGQLREWGILTS